ncbi:MAG: AtpZ/AtpI family protein [Bacteroidetes bacterium]|nr:AtpZ/AtpI family protein [Bacteroidota bacterium]
MDRKKPYKTTPESISETLRELLPYTNLGWQLVASILLFFGIGYGLDHLLGTDSIFTIALSVIGIFVGLWSVIKTANELQHKQEKNK